jgi:hypothetical protein
MYISTLEMRIYGWEMRIYGVVMHIVGPGLRDIVEIRAETRPLGSVQSSFAARNARLHSRFFPETRFFNANRADVADNRGSILNHVAI